MKKLVNSIFVICILVAVLSCQKTEENQITPVLKAVNALIANPWTLDKMSLNGVDVTNEIGDLAFKGLKITFKKDYTYQATPNTTDYFSTGSWRLIDEKTVIINDLPDSFGRVATLHIQKLDNDNFQFYVYYEFGSGLEDEVNLFLKK